VAYTNGQSVSNLTNTAGATVTLYAVWGTVVSGSNLAAKLAWLQTNAQSNTNYIVEVTANESIGPNSLSYSGRTNIGVILIGTGAVRTVSLSSNGVLFTVPDGIALILGNNITLQGHSDNNNSLVRVNSGGTLVMNTGSRITGNTSSTYGGGGVNVDSGTFTMNGGEITGNTSGGVGVGGVYVQFNGTFTMNSGEISGNTASSFGGGVYVSGGTFTMNGGKISGNRASFGGGVFVSGTFIMNGGEISGNTSSSSFSGGGVYVSGTFTMNGGKISGNTGSSGGGVYVSGGTFTMNGGEISGNTTSSGGGGVYATGPNSTFRLVTGTIYGSNETTTSLRNTANSGAALYVFSSSSTAQRGTFSGDTWNSNGSLTTTNNTIRVINGVLQ
jgi:hypothetical protein